MIARTPRTNLLVRRTRALVSVASVSVLLSCALALVACDSPRGAGASALIGPEGGEVAIVDGPMRGARVVVPAGSLESAVQFTIDSGAAPDDVAPRARAVGPMVTFGPAGLPFALPVHVFIPATTEPTTLWTRPHGGAAWSRVGGAVWDVETGLVSADVMHFSDFVPLIMEADGGLPVDTDGSDYCTMYPRDPRCVPPPTVLPGCDAVEQDCATGEMCIATDQDGGYDWGEGRAARCIPAGTAPAGSACTLATDCAPGTQCVFATMQDSGDGLTWFSQEESYLPMYASFCMPLCATAGPSCADASDVCNPVQLWGFSGRQVNETYGVCAPPPGPPPER